VSRLCWLAAGCAALGGGFFVAYVWSEAPHASDMREITYNLGWAAAAIVFLEVIGLLRDWRLAWVAAVPLAAWLVFVAPIVPEHANYNEFARQPTGWLIGLGGVSLIGCVVVRVGQAIAHRHLSKTPVTPPH
jgi:hypothetical protein